MKFFIYSRKSVSSSRGESLENQVELCKNYIYSRFKDANEIEITVYEDDGFSAKTADRPQFLKMQEHIKALKPDFIVCYRLDRISRSVGDFSQFIEELISLNTGFICINEDFDTSKPMGKAMMFITSIFAQLERETIAERVKDNMLMLARTGQWLGGTPPLGFKSQLLSKSKGEKQKSAYYLMALPEEIKTVRLIFESFKKLKSYSKVASKLSEKGILNRNATPFSTASIKQILKNPVYCSADKTAYEYFISRKAKVCFEPDSNFGIIAYNKRNYSKKNRKLNPENDWIIAKGRHKAVIDGESFSAVQNIIARKSVKKERKEIYSLLSGFIYCQKCNNKMLPKKRSQGGFDYICKTKLKGSKQLCNNSNLCGDTLDHEFFDSLLKVMQIPNTAHFEFTDKKRIIELSVLKVLWDGEQLICYLK